MPTKKKPPILPLGGIVSPTAPNSPTGETVLTREMQEALAAVIKPAAVPRVPTANGHTLQFTIHKPHTLPDVCIDPTLHGYVPVSRLNKSIEDRITATVRHNMARGTHQVELSAKLIVLLKKHNWTNARIGMELGMDADEVLRLKQITGLAEAFKNEEFSKSWEPVYDEPINEDI